MSKAALLDVQWLRSLPLNLESDYFFQDETDGAEFYFITEEMIAEMDDQLMCAQGRKAC